jgi:hypothetical protein
LATAGAAGALVGCAADVGWLGGGGVLAPPEQALRNRPSRTTPRRSRFQDLITADLQIAGLCNAHATPTL